MNGPEREPHEPGSGRPGNGPERRPPFFRGAELSRLLLLAGVLIVGWLVVLFRFGTPPPPPRPALTAETQPPLPPAESGPAFQGIQDRHPMTPRDNAAYAELLRRVRETPPSDLARTSRRDVLFSQLLDQPDRYRGLPIHIEGTVRRVYRQNVEGSRIFPRGVYYEGFVFTEDSMGFPWVIAFEEAPPDLVIGDSTGQTIQFDGYFLKLWLYQAGDKKLRFAPLLIGRFPTRATTGGRPGGPAAASRPPIPWAFVLLAAFTVYLGVRVALQFRRMRARPSRVIRRSGVPETIEPDELAAWVEQAEEEGSGDDLPDYGR